MDLRIRRLRVEKAQEKKKKNENLEERGTVAHRNMLNMFDDVLFAVAFPLTSVVTKEVIPSFLL